MNRRASIQPKANDDTWQVIPNLWGMVVAPPGFKKSPALKAVLSPLYEIESEWRRQYQEEKEAYQQELEEWKENDNKVQSPRSRSRNG